MAAHESTIVKLLPEDLRDFLEACITKQSSAEEAYRKLDALANRYVGRLRGLTKQIGEARAARNNDLLSTAIGQYDATLEAYLPVVMAQAHIYWEAENYPQVMALLKQSMDLCSDHEVWKLNVAHTLFMEKQYKDALRYYEQVVRDRSAESILDVTAMVLANQCVAYIMLYQNEQAEEVMKRIERDEGKALMAEPDKQPFHRCIVKLVIGTLYCANHNYEFGVSCLIKALEPYDKKLSPDTWFHAKRCLVGMIELMAKHVLIVEDKTHADVLAFLDEAETVGKQINTTFGDEAEPRTIASEARQLKQMFISMRE
jgi:tetratricopeptide repeat protein 30